MTDPTRPPVSARRAAIGFKSSGQVLSLRLSEESLTTLREAVQADRGGWQKQA